jgi:hypothetical protein
VATEHKAVNGLPCLEGVEIPSGVQYKIYNAWGKPVAENYNDMIQTALDDKADYLVTIEDDQVLQPDSLVRLYNKFKELPEKSCLGAWYPKKEESRQGVHIELDGERKPMPDSGGLRKAYTLAMGLTIYPVKAFAEIPHPWCVTTANLTQDSFLSQLLREREWELWVDTDLKIGHQCRLTGKIYN